MGATNPEKVKMVVKNMETFMPKVLACSYLSVLMFMTMTIAGNIRC